MSVTAVPLRPLAKGAVLKLWLALILLCLVAAAIAWWGTSGLRYATTLSGLQYRVVEDGKGSPPTVTDVALIDYTGRLADGTVFDTTKGKQPVPMPVGGSIPGFSEGLQLMRKGGTYRLRIPPDLGYGVEPQRSQTGDILIPPNSTLEFEVTLHEFLPMAALQGMMGGAQQQGPGGPPPQGPEGPPPEQIPVQ
jgi:hypothetical protein